MSLLSGYLGAVIMHQLGKYQLSSKYPEAVREILLFHVWG